MKISELIEATFEDPTDRPILLGNPYDTAVIGVDLDGQRAIYSYQGLLRTVESGDPVETIEEKVLTRLQSMGPHRPIICFSLSF